MGKDEERMGCGASAAIAPVEEESTEPPRSAAAPKEQAPHPVKPAEVAAPPKEQAPAKHCSPPAPHPTPAKPAEGAAATKPADDPPYDSAQAAAAIPAAQRGAAGRRLLLAEKVSQTYAPAAPEEPTDNKIGRPAITADELRASMAKGAIEAELIQA